MKRCPQCRRDYYDETLLFCLDDGERLLDGPASMEEPSTLLISDAGSDPSGSSFGESLPGNNERVDIPKSDDGNSIAVLPLVNTSSDSENEYFCDGLADELTSALAKIDGLKVAARTSTFRFKGANTDIVEIGQKLGVRSVLEGSVRKFGGRLRISIQLVNVTDGYHLWSERYDRELKDIFEIQDEITLSVVRALKLKLFGGKRAEVLKRYTDNAEAYQHYLRGRYYYASRTKEDLIKGIDSFEQAVKVDPGFALAYAWIADAYASMPAYPYLASNEAFPRSQAAAKRALEIDPSLAEAHTAMAYSLAVFDWDWIGAEREFQRAIELDPDGYETHYRYGLLYLAVTGRHSEAIAEMQRALEIEPLSLITGANLVAVYLYAGENEMALAQARTTYELDPDFLVGRYFLGLAYSVNGMYAQAIDLCETVLRTDPANQLMLRVAGHAHAGSGRHREAENVIAKFNQIADTQYVVSYYQAAIYSSLGDTDQAFARLENAFAQRDWELHRLKVDPFMQPLRSDPRFKEMLERLRLSE